MVKEFKLPDLGEGMQEAEILAVLVSVGDKIKEDDPIFEVETDKATVEIPSPFTGVVREILVKPGDTVEVDAVIMTFDGEGEPEKVEKPAPEQPVEAVPPQKAEPEPPQAARAPITGPVPASPATRRLARELGVDLKSVTPTGPGGLVTAEDVRAISEGGEAPRVEEAPEAPAAPPAQPAPKIKIPGAKPISFEAPPLPDFSKWGDVERVPFRSIRRATATQMAIAWAEIPPVSNHAEVHITNLEDFRQKHKADVKKKDGNLSLTVFVLKAVATALKTYPQFNATLDVEAGEIVLKNYFHIGVAVNTENGLVVPVIRDVDRKSIVELAIE
ncbi:MAG: 2-oxo acid dehydrogenase subunit E2, partial [Deltaproteobacteria bacterium]|nr:2-oxo acid dehydrogenase subunit E2 [Deltaproteobacteria bacterium]